ncbi:hypothetical protein MHK74_10800 [Microbacterium aurum]|uniref:DUF7927 domain-containing protein n=1 Tax=Microbacterium aurum TaxID=36805 RepID=UPI001EF64159|nr:hypothetical protein [Microbacterium aurum]MCG7415044.1 hypothetical protein [Microbacterium aurum]
MRHVYARTRAVAIAAALAACALTLAVAVPVYAAVDSPNATASSDPTPAPEASDSVDTAQVVADDTTGEGNGDLADQSDELVAAPQAARSAQALAAADVSALAATDPTSCVYANATTGEYKDNLCWIDFSYTPSAGQRAAITTEYQQVASTGPTCSQNNQNSRWTCTATLTYASVLGADYGSTTTTGTATSASQTTASNNATANALTNMQATLYVDGTVYYGNVTNYPVSVPLSDGAYTFTAKLSMSAPRSAAQEVRGYTFPTYSASYLGNGIYVVPADIRASVHPAIYQGPTSAGGGTTTVVLSDIQVTQSGSPFSGYSVVVADAESTDSNENIAWSQTGGQGFRWLPNDPTAFAAATTNAARKTAAVGNACPGTDAAMWASLAAPSAGLTCSAAVSSTKTGTAMLQALPPTNGSAFSVTQQMKGGGLQGVAFGVLTSRASVTVTVDNRILTSAGAPSTGSFTAGITGGGLTRTADTGDTALTATRTLELPVPSAGAQLSFATSTTAPNASSYTVAWTCSKTGGGTTTQWPSNGSATPPAANDSWFVLQPSAFINCTVTYTPPYLTLAKSVNNGTTGATNTADQFVLSAAAAGLSSGSAPGSPATKLPVAVGTYNLSESGPTVSPWPYGYDWTALTCASAVGAAPTVTRTTNPATGAVTAATVAVGKSANVTCTYVNTALAPSLTIAKSADPASGTTVDPAQVVTYLLTFDNSAGTAAAPVNHVDHLRDVLDDAVLDASSIRYGTGATPPSSTAPSGVTATPTGIGTATPTIALTGSVPRGQIRTVSFSVTVKATSTDAAARRAETAPLAGYVLRNYLTAADVQPPATCTAPASGAATCTEHNVRIPPIVLPLAGGSGWAGPALVGGLALLLVLALAWWRRRRSTPGRGDAALLSDPARPDNPAPLNPPAPLTPPNPPHLEKGTP